MIVYRARNKQNKQYYTCPRGRTIFLSVETLKYSFTASRSRYSKTITWESLRSQWEIVEYELQEKRIAEE